MNFMKMNAMTGASIPLNLDKKSGAISHIQIFAGL